ncbi:cytochrome P450 [Solwaraspora sp. WMMD1047]|uniref:cytochrome P450 n=1 Tax=Solwaraspora sp. WMMD1047 TaxID=3016102 RepID=UPI002417D13E|nr:cytochrome P450 [Solwaraspora sp. WMMD1047]MDG4830588.1 cytochrome P450 [Solwaraspora sp. WMMD1047]
MSAPGGWPVVGHAPALLTRRLEFLSSLAAVSEVVRIRLGPVPAYVVTHPALVRRLLVPGDQHYDRGLLMEKAGTWFGDSLLTSYGESHQRQRRALRSAFTNQHIAAHVRRVRDETEKVVDSWTPGRAFALDEHMNDLALTSAARSLFSTGLTNDKLASIRHNMPVLFRGVLARTAMPNGWDRLPTPGNIRFRTSMRAMDALVNDIITARRAEDRGPTAPDDLLTSLLAVRDDNGDALSVRAIRDQVMTLLVAGSETTGAVLAWALYEIFRNPRIEDTVRRELDEVLGNQELTLERLSSLTYLERVISETLRRYPVPFIMRRTIRPVRLGEVDLPAHAEIVFSPYILHHDRRWFPQPRQFDPDRWLPGRADSSAKDAYIPFGAGAHVCIGKRMALAAVATSLAVICFRQRLEPAVDRPIREVATGTVHPDRMPMIPRPLSSAHEGTA